MFWHCQIIGIDVSFWNLPELLIYKTTAFANNSNTEFLEFRSQCQILLGCKSNCFLDKMSRKALNRVLTLPDYRNWRELLKSSGIIDLQNNRVCKQFKHWNFRISVPMSDMARLQIQFLFGKMSQKALNRVLTLPDYSTGLQLLISCGIIDFENKNISVVRKQWKYWISVPMSYIAFVQNIKLQT